MSEPLTAGPMSQWREFADFERETRRFSMEAPMVSAEAEPEMHDRWRETLERKQLVQERSRRRLLERFDGFPDLVCECGFEWRASPAATRWCPSCGSADIARRHPEADARADFEQTTADKIASAG